MAGSTSYLLDGETLLETGVRARSLKRKPRIGVILTEFAVPSEVWALRQCREFSRVEPVIFAFRPHPGVTALPADLDVRFFGAQATEPNRLSRRVAAKLGLASGFLPSRPVKAEIRRALLEADLDGVLCHFAWNAIAVTAAVSDFLPVVTQVHGRDVSALLQRPVYRRALGRTLPRLSRLVAVGSHQIETLRPLGLGAHDVIPCGAPLALFATGALPVRAPEAPCRFISVGRISAEKGPLQTLRAFETIVAQGIEAELVCIGDGPLMAELRTACAASPAHARIRLPGMLPPEAVATELARAHVYVGHSRPVGNSVEGFGVSLTEAGAAGLPLASSDLGGIVDQLTHGDNALLFKPGDVDAQASHMRRLATDETLRQQMGRRAREMAFRFDSRQMTARLEDVLLEAVRSGTDAPAGLQVPG